VADLLIHPLTFLEYVVGVNRLGFMTDPAIRRIIGSIPFAGNLSLPLLASLNWIL
jgi:hypothetical protein